MGRIVYQSFSPENAAGCLSKLYSWWIVSLLRVGSRREVELEEIHSVAPGDSTSYLGTQLSLAWEKQLQTNSPNLHKAIFKTFGVQFGFLTLACTISNCLHSATSLLLGCLLMYFEGRLSPSYGFVFAILLVLGNLLISTLNQYSQFGCNRMGMNIRVAVTNLLFEKSLKLSQQSLAASGVGQAVNMISNDVSRYDWSLRFLPYLVSVPVQLSILVFVISESIGPSFLAGVGLFILLIPVQGLIGSVYGRLRASVAKKSDRRLRLLAELINGMELLKVACWEKPFSALLSRARQDELGGIGSKWRMRALNTGLYEGSSKLVILLSVLKYVYSGNVLTPEKVFVGFSLYKNTMLSITELFPTAVAKASELYVSNKRIQEFLLLTEKPFSGQMSSDQLNKGLQLDNVSTRWVQSSDQQETLTHISLSVRMGELVLVSGQVGSGKSSLLQLVMGELEAEDGLVSVRGRVAYVSQDAWLFPGSVKQNILLGSDYDERWYNVVLEACALKRDVGLFSNGDLTVVGDRGVGLSGGQRARVSLARAVYSRADIYLLDDPLSAVDAAVAKHIVDNCMKGLLRDKCVLMVINQLHLFPPETRVLILENGRVTASGKMEELQSKLDTFHLHQSTAVDEIMSEDLVDTRKTGDSGSSKARALEQESRYSGSVTWRLYLKYLKAGNSSFAIRLLFVAMVTGHVLLYACDYYLKVLTDTVTKSRTSNSTSRVEERSELVTYAWVTAAVFLASMIKAQIFYHICLSSSSAIYRSAFKALLRAPMRFFDENSNGRIMNRFSTDVGVMDEAVPLSFYLTVFVVLELVATLVVVVMVRPVIIAFVAISIPFFLYIRMVFLSSASRVKRLEGIARSPVFAQFSSTMEGLSTIRCFGAQNYFKEEFVAAQDVHSSAWFAYLSLGNWCAMTGSTLGTTLFSIILCSFMFDPGESSSAGLAIALALTLNASYCSWIRFTADLTNQLVSVERVMDYATISSEAPLKRPSQRAPKNWPAHGKVSIHDLVVQYGEAPPVIHGISISIQPSQKVGIVGRSGAGKSSLIAALFRLVEPAAGRIEIDGMNLHDLGLHDVRSAIAFIPQNPVLFSGTVRKNLDPFGKSNDLELWNALVTVQLESRMSSDAIGSGLDSSVSDGGGNLSQGERQLICLARNLLIKRKIVVLDEATANIDPRTEKIIQQTLRTHFEDSTVIVVAHRLETVIELDQICFLDAGRVLEFGEPMSLLENPEGKFRELVARTGKDKAERLRALAYKAHQERLSRRTTMVHS